ncbi:MAG: hypothetical protein JWO36_1740 [Myxococcales bacterium]|nr:hypothetical protein [Myxococcales bacterium]
MPVENVGMTNAALAHLADLSRWFETTLEILLRREADAHFDPAEGLAKAWELQTALKRREREELLPSASLAERLRLSGSEEQVVALLAAIAIDSSVRQRTSLYSGSIIDPTLEGLRKIVFGATASIGALTELGPDGKLRRLGIIERSDGGGPDVHESRQTWAISRRILALLHGDTSIDPALAGIVRIVDDVKPVAELAVSASAIEGAREAMRAGKALVIASGMPGLGRRTLIAAAAKEAGLELLEIDGKKLAKEPGLFRKQLRMIVRECKLLARLPLVRNVDALVDEKDASRIEAIGSELAAEIDGPIFVTCGAQRPALRWDRPSVVVELAPPTSAQRAELWRAALDAGSIEDADFLATQYPLAPAMIHHAAIAARSRATGRKIRPDDIYAGIRAVLDDRLGNFAKRVNVTQSWDDLVLPQDQLDAVTELVARIRQRRTVYEQWGFAAKVGKGLGVSALFSGPPGTGKTMVAALIARELGLELYQVDMGKVVSKWIGETERNLGELFDAAEAGHAILLFDEADSLFGKRTEVKSSNDRYANLETNYLLQRLESFTGICVLTSNHEANIDPAFQRRLSLHLRFEVPDVDERAQLWRSMLPSAAPVEPLLDFTRLAKRFAMTGGYIRNAALRAAFLAADEGSAITAAHLERAAQLEYEGMGKIVAGAA